MGVETPIPPEAMDIAAPDGAPPRRFSDENIPAPPCLEEALRRGIIVTPDHVTDFHCSAVNSRSCAFQQSQKMRKIPFWVDPNWGAHSTFAQTYANRWNAVICPKIPKSTSSQPNQPSP